MDRGFAVRLMLTPIEIASGLVSSVDSMSSATSKLVNFHTDAAAVNRVRPALTTFSTTGLGAVLANIYRWRTWLVGADVSRNIWALADSAPTVWNALSDGTAATQLDGATRPVFAEDADKLLIAGGGSIQKWAGVGLSARLGGGPQCSHIVNVAQRIVANDLSNPSRVLWSNLGSGADQTWDALAFATAESRPDPIVAIGENAAELTIWGTTTTETWGISVDPLTPYQRIVTMNRGMSAPYSYVRYNDFHCWMDEKRRFVQSDGRTDVELSEAISRDLRNLSKVTDCFGFREDSPNFHGFLWWTFPTDGRTFVYDYTDKKWSERAYYSAGANGRWPVTCVTDWDAQNAIVCGSSLGATVSKLDGTVRLDDSAPIVSERVTGWFDFGTQDWKRSSRSRFVLRRGTTPLGGTTGQLEVAVADDGRGWGSFKTITIGELGDQEMEIDLYFGGVFRNRRYWLRYSGSNEMSLVGVYDDVIDLESQDG